MSAPPLANTNWQYRDNFYPLCPTWLQQGYGEQYTYVLETMRDVLLDKASQAVLFRMPGLGDASQLPYLAYDRQLVQGLAETSAQFAARLSLAFAAWKLAGSRRSILAQLQAYAQNQQPGVSAALPEFAIVSSYPASIGFSPSNATGTTWTTQYQGDAIGALPTLQAVSPLNWNWDGAAKPWRAWLVVYLALVAAATGTGATVGAAAPGTLCLTGPQGQNQYGSNVNGVWVPNGTGTPVNSPWLTITGITGNPQPGQWLTMVGCSHAGNNGTFPVVANLSATSCVIANPSGVASDTSGAWSLGAYPWFGPGTVWGAASVAHAPPYVFGQGQTTPPPISTGQLVGGVWVPSSAGTSLPTVSWGLSCPSTTIAAIRSLLQAWKSAGTYYESIVVAVDGGTGAPGSAYSPNSTPGSGNPDGTFGGHGKLVSGVWVPNRLVTSRYDAHCQGTGSWNNCSVPNVT